MNPVDPPFSRITVAVPVCGRADSLPRCIDSLCSQSFNGMELLVVTDGSVDTTDPAIAAVGADSRLKIRHVHLEKAGRHLAINKAIEETATELFMLLSPCDRLIPDALNIIVDEWNTIVDKERYAGIQCLCCRENGEIVGTPFRRRDTNNFELRMIDGVTGQKGMVYQTTKLKPYSLPGGEGETVPDAILHNRVSRGHLTRCMGLALVIQQQLSDATTTDARATGLSVDSVILQINELNYFPMPPKLYLTINGQYVKLSLLNGRRLRDVVADAVNKRPLFVVAALSGFFGAATSLARERRAGRAAK